MATFEEVGIRYLTAASVQSFRDNSALWVLRYLFGKKDFRSPAFARSLALNDGLKHTLHFDGDVGGGEDVALASYMGRLSEFEIDPEFPDARNEHDNILPMFNMAVKAIQEKMGTIWGLPRPNAAGLATHAFIGEMNTPFLSTPSFIWDTIQLHVKFTNRCPSRVQPKDLMAMSVDAAARIQPPAVLYITAKRYAGMQPAASDLATARFSLEEDARALESFLGAVESPEQALSMCPLNPEFYQWKPQLLAEARLILLNSKDYRDAVARAQGRGISEGHPRHAHGDLLSDYRPGDAEIDL